MSHPTTLLEPSRHEHRAAGAEPASGAAEDWTVPQRWDELTGEDHWVWDTLFARQKALLRDKVVGAFEEGLEVLKLSRSGVPKFEELNVRLGERTGWQVVAVPSLLPDRVFFEHLANRRFPAGNFVRTQKQMDYLEEPDVFHDVFGHVPLLARPTVADFMVELGNVGLEALRIGELERVARLYWYTVEVGLAREDHRIKIYGAGIASSFGETRYSLESSRPHRLKFDLKRVLRTRYRPDNYQKAYFVIDRFEEVLNVVRRDDFAQICAELKGLPDIDPHVADRSELLDS
jgi:phenylalanine-4-hydroxylase